jgi:hypothetical protein
MDEREPIRVVRDEKVQGKRSQASAWLATGVVILVIALGLTIGYIFQQQNNARALMTRDNGMSATIDQMQNEIDSLTSKLNQAPPAATTPSATPVQPGAARAASRRQAATTNKRFKEMQAKLDDQQKQLKDTQDQVAQTRSDFEAGLNSTRDDLNGSIARTHDELVSLEQRGERNYFEFDITKAKHFRKEGPLMVSLRKADPKHKRYDLALVVDDNQLSKKNINLYEPVWIDGSDRQQVQLVVNKIDRDHIHGYVSAPKYSPSAAMTNVSDRSSSVISGADSKPGDASNTPATANTGTTDDASPTTSTPQRPQTHPQP